MKHFFEFLVYLALFLFMLIGGGFMVEGLIGLATGLGYRFFVWVVAGLAITVYSMICFAEFALCDDKKKQDGSLSV